MKRKRSYDNYDYNEAYQYDLDKEIEKAAKEKFRRENPLLIDFEEQWKEQQAKLEEWEYERLLKEGKVESLYRTSTIKCKNIKSGKEIAEVMIYPSFYNRADMPHTKKNRETVTKEPERQERPPIRDPTGEYQFRFRGYLGDVRVGRSLHTGRHRESKKGRDEFHQASEPQEEETRVR